MSETQASRIEKIVGRPIPVRGDDIDTDRIIPARYLRCVTFDGLEEHAFEDDRRDLDGKVTGEHPFDQKRFAGASILIANNNFGCGSSREHAPQALVRWGIRAFVAESFAEIFFGNCVALGTPCVTVDPAAAEKLQDWAEANPDVEIEVDVKSRKIITPEFLVQCGIPDGPREAFIEGTWDATSQLIDSGDEIDRVAGSLPYTSEFS